MECKHRKTTRLQGFDYNIPGCYFITVCTKDKKKLLCEIVGTGLPDGPKISLTKQGKIAQFVGTFKRFCNREIGENIWQYRSHDHIIRGEADYLKIWNYIDGNPSRWLDDCFYVE